MTQYCIIFRSGGTGNFKWHRSLAISRDEADSAIADMDKAGHICFIENYQLSMSIGLPEVFHGPQWRYGKPEEQAA